jgi:hypothetical protein
MRYLMKSAAAFVLLMAPGAAWATVLDFDTATSCTGGCGNGASILQTYGDAAGVDMTYGARSALGNSALTALVLQWWDTNYGDLLGVAWSVGTLGEIAMLPTAGYEIELISMDLAGWPNIDRSTQVTVFSYDYASILFSSGAITAPGVGHITVSPNLAFNSTGFRIQWGPDAINTGMDNVVFNTRLIVGPVTPPVTGVPEPMTLSLLGAGLAGIGWVRRRRE